MRLKFCMDSPFSVKKAEEHGIYFRFAPRFFRTWWCRCVPFLTLSFCFWIVLKDPCFVTCNHVLQEISVPLDPFQKMKTHVLPIVLLFDCQVLGTNFAHNFFMANSSAKIWWTVVWFKFNSLAIIRTVSRRSDRTRARTISTLLSVFFKLKVFQSGVHLWWIHGPLKMPYTTWTLVISTKHAPHRPVSVYWKCQCRFPQVWHKTWLDIVARNCAVPFPCHTQKLLHKKPH